MDLIVENLDEFYKIKKQNIVNLTDQQATAARKIAKSLSKCIGRENAVTKDSIIEGMAKLKIPYIINKDELSKMIQYIRFNNLCGIVIETNQTYYVESDIERVDLYLKYLINKANEIMQIHHSITIQQSKQAV